MAFVLLSGDGANQVSSLLLVSRSGLTETFREEVCRTIWPKISLQVIRQPSHSAPPACTGYTPMIFNIRSSKAVPGTPPSPTSWRTVTPGHSRCRFRSISNSLKPFPRGYRPSQLRPNHISEVWMHLRIGNKLSTCSDIELPIWRRRVFSYQSVIKPLLRLAMGYRQMLHPMLPRRAPVVR